jgi:trans-aconitate methyltransferase
MNHELEVEKAEILLLNNAKFYNDLRANMIYNLIKEEDIKEILDLGCGTGKITNYLFNKGIKTKGIDTSKRLINIAKKRFKKIEFKKKS